jgi:nucleotide-binding universal stress UspA family protein
MNATMPPGPIVCATRGGEGSRAVKERAIEHALAHDSALIFLYVIDAEAIEEEGPAAGGRALDTALRLELRWMGRVLLEMARAQAERAGASATLVIREGDVREEIAAYVREIGAARLLLGAPRGTTANVFGDDAIERFAEEIASISGVGVEVVRPEA